MPAPKREPVGNRHPGNTKVMVYVAPDVHRAMGQVALDERRSWSSAYVETARAFLEAHGKQVGLGPQPAVAPRMAAEFMEAIDRQGQRIEEIHAAFAAVRGAAPRGGREPAGTTAAEAMKAVLGIMKAVGPAGIASRDLGTAVQAASVNPGAAETAKAVRAGRGSSGAGGNAGTWTASDSRRDRRALTPAHVKTFPGNGLEPEEWGRIEVDRTAPVHTPINGSKSAGFLWVAASEEPSTVLAGAV